MNKLSIFCFLFCLSLFSCGEPEENNEIRPFELVGTWNFVELSAEGKVAGVPQSDRDDNPSGYVEFYDDGHGYSDFDIKLLGFDFSKDEMIQWERIGNTIDIEEEDGAHEIWQLIDTDSTRIEAVWSINFGSLNNADITMKLVKQ